MEGLSLKNLRREQSKKNNLIISYILFYHYILFDNGDMSYRNVISAGGGVSFISVAFINMQLLYNLNSKPNVSLPVRITEAIL